MSDATEAASTGNKAPPRIEWRAGVIVDVIMETSHAKTLVLDVPGWPGHLAGQHVDVRLTAEDGYQAQRSYSIASPPTQKVRVHPVDPVAPEAPPTHELAKAPASPSAVKANVQPAAPTPSPPPLVEPPEPSVPETAPSPQSEAVPPREDETGDSADRELGATSGGSSPGGTGTSDGSGQGRSN